MTNMFVLAAIACCLVIILILLRKVLRIVNGKERYTYSETKTKERYGYVPKPGDLKMMILAFLLMILIGSSCSPTASLPNGCKYKINAPKFKK